MLTTPLLIAVLASATPALPAAVSSVLETVHQASRTEVRATFDVAPAPQETLVARIGPDGSVVTACVASDEAAARFLRKAAEPQPAKRQEQ